MVVSIPRKVNVDGGLTGNLQTTALQTDWIAVPVSLKQINVSSVFVGRRLEDAQSIGEEATGSSLQ